MRPCRQRFPVREFDSHDPAGLRVRDTPRDHRRTAPTSPSLPLDEVAVTRCSSWFLTGVYGR
jgi:hypothetical protein